MISSLASETVHPNAKHVVTITVIILSSPPDNRGTMPESRQRTAYSITRAPLSHDPQHVGLLHFLPRSPGDFARSWFALFCSPFLRSLELHRAVPGGFISDGIR